MPEIISRHRPLALLAAVIAGQVLLLAFQIWHGHNVRLARYWAVEITSPIESAGTWTFGKLGGVWTGYIDLHNARKENRELRQRVDALQLRNRELETKASEADRLESLLDFRNDHREAPMLAAQVIGASADPSSHTIFINRGEHDRVHVQDPVITPDGVAGEIVLVQPNTSEVRLINDKESGVGALFLDSRTHGVVEGTGDAEPRMNFVGKEEKVHVGEEIVTSGEDRIFPKGLLVGSVAAAKTGYPFQTITVAPATRLDRLEDVIVLLSRQELAPKKSSGGSAGVAAGLPAVPEREPEKTARPAAQTRATTPAAPAAANPAKPSSTSPPAKTTPAQSAPPKPPAGSSAPKALSPDAKSPAAGQVHR